jgi:signal transduction histidine kinase
MTSVEINPELSESEWIESESIRQLMQSRSGMMGFASFTMVVMALQLYSHVNTLLLASWLIVSLVVLAFRYNVKALFSKHLVRASIGSQSAFAKRYSLVWTLNAFTWGMSGWLFFTNIPVQNQYICAVMLNVVGFVAVHNLNTFPFISRRFIGILMGTQVLGALWYVGYIEHFQGSQIQYVHLVSLVVIWLVLRIFDKRFYTNFKRNLVLQYRNNVLIQNLNRKSEQLAHEKQIAVNANEVIQRFYSSAAHDIRQPVYALKVYADIAIADSTQLPVLLPKITESCDAINSLFDSLFEFEQINAGHVHVSHHTVDIDEVVDDLERQYKHLARHKNLQFRTNAISGFLQTDQLLVKRILTCFISNALKYTEKGGIMLAVRKSAAGIDFEVWDTGIGIDPEHHAHIFEEFYKVGNFASTDEGFGLGLSVVNKLSAYAENSSITMQSRLGRGSVFRFTLPLKIYAPPYFQAMQDKVVALPLVLDHDLNLTNNLNNGLSNQLST